ncbi:hypothetical protein [Halobacterium salinarum]|uniref:hypothetical protein n=1 Tax=Halobacterium salinarum TaxID=2242 RepID=UPI0025556D4A|nr:hypothetical protein [Halobacterium salinarum]MDL0127078.1 hypothetical protein [Halobacterium salinarum]
MRSPAEDADVVSDGVDAGGILTGATDRGHRLSDFFSRRWVEESRVQLPGAACRNDLT